MLVFRMRIWHGHGEWGAGSIGVGCDDDDDRPTVHAVSCAGDASMNSHEALEQ